MFKMKLQEICQKKSWTLPEYETTREGPPHDSRFSTTVTVNSIPFKSSTPSRTVKLSQNDAAMLAFNHFSQFNPISSPFLPNLSSFPQPCFPTSPFSSGSPGSPVQSPDVDYMQPVATKFIVLQQSSETACQTCQINSPPVSTVSDVTIVKPQHQKGIIHLYKNQLQKYAQKRNLKLPEYSSEWEGPPHALRFRCKVTIDGKTFESPKFFSTLKDAEHAAAEVAFMSLSPSGIQEDDIAMYKNLLQELLHKEGFHLPVYSTNISGEAHRPIFTSQVEVEGEVFTGQESKSKKQSEMSAAKVAFTTLRERKAHDAQPREFSSNFSKANVITGMQHHSNGQSPVSPVLGIQNPTNKDKVEKQSSSYGYTNGCSEVTFSSKSKAIPSFSDSNHADFERSNVSSNAVSTPSCPKKVVVYARKTNIEIEKGGVLLPISDDKYVAYSYSH